MADPGTTIRSVADDGNASEDPVLDVRGLDVDLTLGDTVAPVIRDVSFRVSSGEILGVVGESGSGKSITALSVMGMLPRAARIARGIISYRGTDLASLSPSEMERLRGREIGMVFQDPLAFLNPLMTVGQQIREVLRLHGSSRREAADRALDLLDLVGVRDPHRRIDDYPHEFSGGMRQRVIIAIAVANNPRLLIADEPTTALDVTVQAEILQLLVHLRDQLGSAIVLITHDTGVVEQVCDSAMVMYAGRVVEHGSVSEVLRSPRHPYTRELMRSSLRLDLPPQARLAAIPGQPPELLHRPSGCSFHPRCPLVFDRCRVEDPPLIEADGNASHAAACWLAAHPLPDPAPPDSTTPGTQPGAQQPAGQPGAALLEVDDVRISYGPSRRWWGRAAEPPVVDGVTLRAYPGRALGLVGESGSGKSTVARAIVGLLGVQSGTIRIDGRSWDEGREVRAALRRTVQMVFQDPYQSLNPRQSIRDILAEPLVVHRIVEPAHIDARVSELLGLVGLSRGLLHRWPYQLSGGQRQRIGIARALAMEARLLIADEPVSSLDVSIQAQIINLLADLRDQLGLAYVVIAHDLGVVRHLCEDVAVMQNGVIVEQGPSEEIFTRAQHPFTRELLAASPGSVLSATSTPSASVETTGGEGEPSR